jgi:hypothetical protein
MLKPTPQGEFVPPRTLDREFLAGLSDKLAALQSRIARDEIAQNTCNLWLHEMILVIRAVRPFVHDTFRASVATGHVDNANHARHVLEMVDGALREYDDIVGG